MNEINKRKAFGTVVLGLMLIIAGCSGLTNETDGNSGEEIAESTGDDLSDVKVGESFMYEMKKTEQNQEGLVKGQPPEVMDSSLERQNLKDRNEYLNDQNNQHYVYLMSHGKVVTWFTAQGKVSSVNSKLTNDKQLVKVPNPKFDQGNGAGGGNGVNYKVVESPAIDGSYGSNGNGIFFFTTDGRYVEWNGEYVVSEQQMNIETPVQLTEQVDDNESE